SITLLRKVSPWFDSLFESGIIKSPIVLHVVDLNAFTILMDCIHERNEYPLSIPLYTLAMIASLVDFLDCAKSLDFLPKIWIDALWKHQNWSFQRDVVLWIYITQVFKDSPKHKLATRSAIMLWPHRFNALGLHIKRSFVDELNWLREKSMSAVLAPLQNLAEELRFGQSAYDFEQEALILGTIHQMFPPIYFVPSELIRDCCSISQIVEEITNVKEPSGGGPSLRQRLNRLLGVDYFWEYGLEFGAIVAETKAVAQGLKGLDLRSDDSDGDEYGYEKIEHGDGDNGGQST
ncbi:hypothetical protein F5Y09DRAFT_357143, partial [Xylaria sp. FL1042]